MLSQPTFKHSALNVYENHSKFILFIDNTFPTRACFSILVKLNIDEWQQEGFTWNEILSFL